MFAREKIATQRTYRYPTPSPRSMRRAQVGIYLKSRRWAHDRARAARTAAVTAAPRPQRFEIGDAPGTNLRVSRSTTLARPEPGRVRHSIRAISMSPAIYSGPWVCPTHQAGMQLKRQKTSDPILMKLLFSTGNCQYGAVQNGTSYCTGSGRPAQVRGRPVANLRLGIGFAGRPPR